MGIWAYIINKSKSSAVLVLLISLFSYFSYFAIKGDRGYLKYMYLQDKVADAERIKDNYDKRRAELEQKVSLLSPRSLDLDLLDERARVVLNVIGDNEFIIIDDEDDEPTN